jgi:glycosyltransferase involved in cell wall biosynthesis
MSTTTQMSTVRQLDDRDDALRVVRHDLLIHALGQLADGTALTLGAAHDIRSSLEQLVYAYAIGDRVSFHDGAGVPDGGRLAPSMAELVHQLRRPDDHPASIRERDDMFDGHRIALVTNLPAPYRLPLFERMAERLERAGAAFKVFFLSEGDRHRSWMNVPSSERFDHEVLRSVEIPIRKRRPSIPMDLGRRLRAFEPSIVVVGGLSPAVAGRSAVYARRHRIPLGIWSGEHASMSTAQSRLRRIQRRRLLASANFAIAYGFESGEYLRSLASGIAVVHGRNTAPVTPSQRPRADSNSVVKVLAVGDLGSARKGIDVAIAALSDAGDLLCELDVIGGGRLLESLRASVAHDTRIRFLGPLSRTDVAKAYASADIFLFPSRADVFGLALVEAMGAGAAVVTSRAAGGVSDLCVHDHNCIVLDTYEPHEWALVLRRLVTDARARRELGDNAQETIASRWTIDHAADAMIAGLRLPLFGREREQVS